MAKLDLVQEYKVYYKAGTKPEMVEFGPIEFLAIEGKGEPEGEVFTRKIGALYPLAYGIKKVCKDKERDFGVPKLEGLWWVEGNKPALEVPRSKWCWKLLIRMPEFVTKEMMGKARSTATERMTTKAAKMGADAVINVHYMTTSVVASAAELLVYGTAVRLS